MVRQKPRLEFTNLSKDNHTQNRKIIKIQRQDIVNELVAVLPCKTSVEEEDEEDETTDERRKSSTGKKQRDEAMESRRKSVGRLE